DALAPDETAVGGADRHDLLDDGRAAPRTSFGTRIADALAAHEAAVRRALRRDVLDDGRAAARTPFGARIADTLATNDAAVRGTGRGGLDHLTAAGRACGAG